MSVSWTISGNPLLRCRQWGDEYVVYHEQSGDTHLLDQAGISILNYLTANTADIDAIFAHIAQTAGMEVDVDELEEMLGNLTRLGLVQVVS
jgi:PqqD family protein of HPr-rel-A system